MEVNQAEAIIVEAKSSGVYEAPMPEADDKKLQEASEIVAQAEAANRAGIKSEAVVSILNIASMNGSTGEVEEVKHEKDSAVDIKPSSDQSLEEQYTSQSLPVEFESLPIPSEYEGTTPELPADFTQLGNDQIRRLHSEFNACSARARYLLVIEETYSYAAKTIYDHYFEQAFWATKKEEKAVKYDREIEARNDKEVSLWFKRYTEHDIKVRNLKKLMEIYDNHCDRLSREWTMRTTDLNNS